jgi:nicotinamide-nucleotide amidase
LAIDGPVADRTGAQLAVGARERCGADWGVGLTGVAGPDWQDGRPPGTVFIGVAGPDGVLTARPSLEGDRWAIRLGAVAAAVEALLARLE